jgi:type IV secretory pathway TraG/TraD family ATPase VirD4
MSIELLTIRIELLTMPIELPTMRIESLTVPIELPTMRIEDLLRLPPALFARLHDRIIVVWFGTALAVALAFWRWARCRPAEAVKRGVRIVDSRPSALRRCLEAAGRSPDAGVLRFGGVPISALDETKHFKLIGTTGTGKSTAIHELLGAALARGDRAVIADPDGGYQARLLQRYRGDVVLNPFERDSVKWDWFAEISNPYDLEQLASGLIPAGNDAAGQEWRGYARTFFTAVARRCHASGRRDAEQLWRLLNVAAPEELRSVVAGTPAQPFLEPDNARMFGSIRSVTGSAVAAFDYIRSQRARPFSVRAWVRDGSSPGILFLPYKASQIAALRSLIATWMRIAIFEAMSQPENRDQRLWFVVDELDALGPIDGLKDALARLRKFGGRCVLGFQSIAQVSATYGGGDAQTLVENCGNTLILRCSGSEHGGTSEFASRLIGEREIVRRQTSRGRDRGPAGTAGRRSTHVSDNHVTEMAVMPSEIEQLADLCGYLKRASAPEWRKVVLRRASRPAARRARLDRWVRR